jgi:RimJ/RimL family protein N-acetyltransferase
LIRLDYLVDSTGVGLAVNRPLSEFSHWIYALLTRSIAPSLKPAKNTKPAKQYWNQNLGSEVALALAQLSAERYPDKMLVAKVHPDNVAAISILTKFGMIQSGTINKLGSYDNGFLRFEKGKK